MIFFSVICFLTVLHLVMVSATRGSMRRFLDPTVVASQYVPESLLCLPAQSQEHGRVPGQSYCRKAGQGHRRSLTHQEG